MLWGADGRPSWLQPPSGSARGMRPPCRAGFHFLFGGLVFLLAVMASSAVGKSGVAEHCVRERLRKVSWATHFLKSRARAHSSLAPVSPPAVLLPRGSETPNPHPTLPSLSSALRNTCCRAGMMGHSRAPRGQPHTAWSNWVLGVRMGGTAAVILPCANSANGANSANSANGTTSFFFFFFFAQTCLLLSAARPRGA